LAPAAAAEMDLDISMEDSCGDFCSPALQSMYIIDVGSNEVEARLETMET
jgi:hypothetical protein